MALPSVRDEPLPEPTRPALRSAAEVVGLARLHIAAIGAMGTLTFGWLFTGRYPWLIALVSGLDWLLVNLLNRVVDVPEDAANRIAGADLAQRHRRTIIAAGLGLLVGSLVAMHALAPALTPWRLGYHALGLSYNWPLLPGRRRIKQLYFWKNFASATGFVLTGFAYPLSVSGWGPLGLSGAARLPAGIGPLSLALTIAYFLPFELSYEVIYDLRDITGDRAAGVKSYPAVHGAKGAVRIIDALLGVSLAFVVAGYALHLLPWRIAIMAVAPLVQLGTYKRALRRGIDARFCTRLTWLGVAMLLVYHLSIVLHLPGTEIAP